MWPEAKSTRYTPPWLSPWWLERMTELTSTRGRSWGSRGWLSSSDAWDMPRILEGPGLLEPRSRLVRWSKIGLRPISVGGSVERKDRGRVLRWAAVTRRRHKA